MDQPGRPFITPHVAFLVETNDSVHRPCQHLIDAMRPFLLHAVLFSYFGDDVQRSDVVAGLKL